MLVTTPFLLHHMGVNSFGFWMLLNATVSLGSILNAGTGAATIKFIASNIEKKDITESTNIINTSLLVALSIGGLLAILICVAFMFMGDRWFGKMGDISQIKLIGVAAAVLFFIEQIDNVFSSALKGAELFGIAARIEITSKLIQMVAAVLAAYNFGGDLEPFCVALILAAIARFGAKVVAVRRKVGFALRWPADGFQLDVLHYAKWGWLQGIGGLLFGTADRLLVGSALGAVSLAHYSIASQLAQQIQALASAGLSVIFPKISRKKDGSSKEGLWIITRMAMLGNFLVSSALAGILLIAGKEILTLWLGADEAGAINYILFALVIVYWILALNVVPYYVLMGLGMARFIGILCVVSGLLSIITSYILITKDGLIGVAFGKGVYAVLTLSLIFVIKKHLNVVSGENNFASEKEGR